MTFKLLKEFSSYFAMRAVNRRANSSYCNPLWLEIGWIFVLWEEKHPPQFKQILQTDFIDSIDVLQQL